MHPVEFLRIGEVQDRRGHQFKRISTNTFEVDISLSREKSFKQLDLESAIKFFEGIQ